MMNVHVDDQPSTYYRPNLTLDSSVENQNQPVMQIVILPASAPHGAATTQSHRAKAPVTRGFKDDIAYATWEDAEWR